MISAKTGAKSVKIEFATQTQKDTQSRESSSLQPIDAKSRIFEFAAIRRKDRRKVGKNRVCARRTQSYITYRCLRLCKRQGCEGVR